MKSYKLKYRYINGNNYQESVYDDDNIDTIISRLEKKFKIDNLIIIQNNNIIYSIKNIDYTKSHKEIWRSCTPHNLAWGEGT